ncbi:MAG: glycosyltransferase [Sulfuricaulis sp.]|uniref:glycosyltransferase n=1 Tax=Sulfuricaulis sp. TaxID=2003553 RepID=UPI0025F1BDDE|nr:glycosyltransferase [Sulfuricaulis sp.]MCR4346529.1 glycosyltransferase [Sulfuricaulis sp.]
MRILHIIESLDFGGAEKVTVSLANGMAASHDVTICCLKRVGVLGTQTDKRVRIVCLDKGEGNEYLLPLRLAGLIRKHGFDVVHTHNWAVFLEGGLAGLLAGTRILIHTVHGPYADYAPSRLSRFKIAVRHTLERRLARRFCRIATVSDAIRSYIEKDIRIPARHLITVHNGIPANNISFIQRPERPHVTFMTVGRLAPIKNHALMLRAFHTVSKGNPNVRLVIVGDGPERPALERFIRENGLDDKVTLPGFRDDIDLLLREADVFLLTSHYEGISIALLEAMRAGLPAIGTAVGGIPETIIDGKTGLLVAPDSQEDLVKAMLRLADSKTGRDDMGRQGYDYFIKEFSLATMLSRYEKLYTGNN